MNKEEASKKAEELLDKIGDLNLKACSSAYICTGSKEYIVAIEGKVVATFPYREREIPKAGVLIEVRDRECDDWAVAYSAGGVDTNDWIRTSNKKEESSKGDSTEVWKYWRPLKTKIELKLKTAKYYMFKFQEYCHGCKCGECAASYREVGECAASYIVDLIKKENEEE